jgi:hypothetical protein
MQKGGSQNRGDNVKQGRLCGFEDVHNQNSGYQAQHVAPEHTVKRCNTGPSQHTDKRLNHSSSIHPALRYSQQRPTVYGLTNGSMC